MSEAVQNTGKAKVARLILLHAEDNVLVAVSQIEAGDLMPIDGGRIVASQDIPFGHKIARTDLPEGAVVLKYGAPIGTVSQAIARGGHLHGHNIRSNYIPSHTREESVS